MRNSRSFRRKSIVDMISKIMTDDQGPDPKLNYRTAEKRPTAAEQFRTENQGPSDTLHCQSSDCVKTVEEHYRAYPRLGDELHKKNSLVKVTTIKGKDLCQNFDWNCNACAQWATYNYLKRRIPKPRCENNKKIEKTSSASSVHCASHQPPIEKLKGVTKPKARKNKNSKIMTLSTNQNHRSCQCSISCITRRASKTTTYSIPRFENIIESKPSDTVNEAKNENPSNLEDDNQRNKNKKHPSISSYNSYGSLDHEPMDV